MRSTKGVTTRTTTTQRARRFVNRVVDWLERVGNTLPDPFTLFLLLFAFVAVVSSVMAAFDVSAQIPGSDELTRVRGLFTAEGLTWLSTTWVENFVNFPPFGVVLTLLLAVGVAQHTGLFSAAVRRAFGRAPRWLLPYLVGLVSVAGSVMGDAAVIVLPVLSCLVFKAVGRHPVAGLIGSFATTLTTIGVSPFVTSYDALVAGITNAAAEPIGGTVVTPVSNYFLMAPVAIVIGLLAGLVIDKVLEPGLIRRRVRAEPVERAQRAAVADEVDIATDLELGETQRRGLWWAGGTLLATAAAVLALTVPPGAPMRNADGGYLPESPLLDSVVFLVFVGILLPALVYGIATKLITGGADIARMMGNAVKEVSTFVVVVFVLAQFLALFTWTQLPVWLAVRGAELLESANLTGFIALIAFIVLAAFVNLFIGSGSAQWTLFAGVFVPMLALLGFEPGFIQAAFRIGDGTTNALSPLNPYLVVLLSYLRSYEPGAGIGTVIARSVPFAVLFFFAWIAIFAVFYFGGVPVGPGMSSHL